MLNSTRRRWLPLMKYAPAREAFERSINSKQQRLCALNAARAAAITPQDPADAPLSDKELAALKNLGKAPEGSEGDWTNPQGLPRRGEGAMGGARVNVSLADFIREDADTLSDGMLAAVAGVRSRATNGAKKEGKKGSPKKKQQGAAKGESSECRSPDPEHCSNHGTPIKRVHHSKWTPRDLPKDITADEARSRLAGKGYKLTDPTGEEITVDGKSIAHWVKAGKTEEDKNARLAMLPTLDALITAPHEIWEGTFIDKETGEPILQRTYLARFQRKDKKTGKTYGKPKDVLTFTHTINQKTHTHTFREASDIEAKRKGTLVYADTEKTDAPSA